MTRAVRVILGTASIFLATAGSALAGQDRKGPADLLPEGTLIAVGTDDFNTMLDGLKSGAVGQIFGEQEVQDFLEQPMQMMQGLIQEGLAAAKSEAGLEVDLEQMMKGPFGRAFLAVTHVTLPDMESQVPVPDVGVVFGLEAGQGATDLLEWGWNTVQAIAKAELGEALPVETVTVGELSYQKIPIPEPGAPSVIFAKVGGMSMVTLSEKSIQSIMGLATQGGASLASSAGYRGAAAATGSMGRGAPVVWADLSGVLGVVKDGLTMAAAMNKEDEELAMALRAFEICQLDKLGRLFATANWVKSEGSGKSVAATKVYWRAEPGAGGILTLGSAQKPVNKDWLKVIPKNALSFSLSNLDLAPVWDTLIGAFKQAAPELYGEAMAQLNGFQAQIAGADEQGNPNWDIRRDLIGAMGGEFGSVSLPGPATMFGPGTESSWWLQVKDPAALEKSIQILFSLPGQFGFPLSFNESKHGEVTIKALDLSQLGPMAMAGAAMQPCYAMADGRVWFGSSTNGLKKLMDLRKAPPEENVTAKEDFRRVFSMLRKDGELTSISYGATADNFENYYSSILGILPMMMMGAPIDEEDFPVDLSLLPTAEAISKHLFGSIAANFKLQDGAILTEMYGPFGPEVTMGAVLAAGAIGVGSTAMRTVSPVGPPMELEVVEAEATPEAQVQQDLADLNAAVTVFMIEFGNPPAALAELVTPKENYPNGIFVRPQLPQDPWGNDYHYKAKGSGGYAIWSNGPNGIDEGGAGDDVKTER